MLPIHNLLCQRRGNLPVFYSVLVKVVIAVDDDMLRWDCLSSQFTGHYFVGRAELLSNETAFAFNLSGTATRRWSSHSESGVAPAWSVLCSVREGRGTLRRSRWHVAPFCLRADPRLILVLGVSTVALPGIG